MYCYARDIANRFYPEKFEPTFHPERLAAPQNTWTKAVERGIALAKQFRDGTCQVNCHNTCAYGLPYGGQGISGGPGSGVNCEDTFRDYTQVKAIYVAKYPE